MNYFFLLLEVFGYALAAYLFVKKGELAIIYIPILIFINNLIDPVFSAFVYYGTISALLLFSIAKNPDFYRHNVFAVLLFFLFLVLLSRSSDLVLIRQNIFAVLWLFVSIPLISAVYRKYDEQVIFREITGCAFIVLLLFLANVLVSTLAGYSPTAMYGISKGVLYGNLYAAGFNILAIAIFVTVLKFVQSKSPIDLFILVLSFGAVFLSLRRSVMMVGAIGIAIGFLAMLTQKDIRKFILFGGLLFIAGYVFYSSSDFMSMFNERYELRNLDDRELEGEARFLEYNLIYTDMFINNEYSPWIGYEPLNSAGNYGRGVFELRTLHADIPSIAHSSGIIGLALYFFMVITAFRQVLKASKTNLDKLIIFFSVICFCVYTVTGRFTEAGSMILLFLVIKMPLAKSITSYVPEATADRLPDSRGSLQKIFLSRHTIGAERS